MTADHDAPASPWAIDLYKWHSRKPGRTVTRALGLHLATAFVARWTGCIRVMSGFAWGEAIAPVVREWLKERRVGW